jgi:hypothetical protein
LKKIAPLNADLPIPDFLLIFSGIYLSFKEVFEQGISEGRTGSRELINKERMYECVVDFSDKTY